MISNDDYLQTYAYDIIGNITNKSDIGNYLYGNNNPYQASAINNQAYAYDLNGNLTSDANQTYNYNYQDRLIKVISIDQMIVSAFQYDNAGQRTYKKAVDHNNQTTTETYYFNRYFEARRVNQQLDSITKHLFFGNQRVAQVKNVDDINAVSLIFTDHLGSSSVVTDSTGVITAIYDYYPYGGSRIEQENGVEIAYRYTGKEHDNETGLNYFGARYQAATLGRFTQVDPRIMTAVQQILSDPQALNGYAYARNNPIRYIDPNGETFKEFFQGSVKGAWEGVKDLASGVIEFVQNPTVVVTGITNFFGQSGSDLGFLIQSYFNDPEGTVSQIKEACSYYIKGWENLSDEEKGKIVGYALEKSLETYVAVKGINKALKDEPKLSTSQNDQTVDMVNVMKHKEILDSFPDFEILENGNMKLYSKFKTINNDLETNSNIVKSRFAAEIDPNTSQTIRSWEEFIDSEGAIVETHEINIK